MKLLSHGELVRMTPPERLATIALDRRNGITWAALKAELEQRCS
jgi:hypothetical protein